MKKIERLSQIVKGDVFLIAAETCPSDHKMKDFKGCKDINLSVENPIICFRCWMGECDD